MRVYANLGLHIERLGVELESELTEDGFTRLRFSAESYQKLASFVQVLEAELSYLREGLRRCAEQEAL